MSEYDTEQLPEVKVHDDDGENDPVSLELPNETVPVGEEPPDTVATQVDELLVVIKLGRQLSFVVVCACDPPVIAMCEVVPELARLAESPP